MELKPINYIELLLMPNVRISKEFPTAFRTKSKLNHKNGKLVSFHVRKIYFFFYELHEFIQISEKKEVPRKTDILLFLYPAI